MLGQPEDAMTRKIILVELNEVPWAVYDRYAAGHPQSALARIFARTTQYRTRAEDRHQLDPWITWPTFHRGVNDEQHGIFHLGQNLEQVDRDHPPIWRLLRAAGRSVGVFGSLHSSHVPEDIGTYAFYLPDVFAEHTAVHPPSLASFQRFNLAMTRASARNVDRRIPLPEAAAFVKDLPRLGVRAGTLRAVAAQLAGEVRHRERKTRRRAIQTLLMADVFLKLMRETRPDFATFYSNHVAAAMHRYWTAAFPQDAPGGVVDPAWQRTYRAEVDYAMDEFSRVFARICRFAVDNPDYIVVVAGSMGQAAIPSQMTYEFLTVTGTGRFMRALGVPDGAWKERFAMVPCVSVEVAPEYRDAFRAKLDTLTIGGQRIVRDRRPLPPIAYDESEEGGTFHLFIQFDSYAGPARATVGEVELPFEELGLGMMAHEDGVNCTAQHVPEGALAVFDPRARPGGADARPEVSALDFVPSVLANYGLPIPGGLRGRASIAFE
jgi:hypothetical protein